MKKKKQGFTLIELSIVLVIIGLLVGGVLVGKELIEAAQLRSTIGQKESFQTATQTFKLKYNCLPGDCKNATTFFGAAAVCPGDGDNPRTDGTTCNGDGDKRISTNASPADGQNEAFGYWQHLAIAGLIEGSYTGVTDNTTNYYGPLYTLGANIPKSTVTGGGWAVYDLGSVDISNAGFPEGSYGNSYFLAGEHDGTSTPTTIVLKPIQAKSIDNKLDDGLPMLGKVSVHEGNPAAAAQCYLTNLGAGIGMSTTQPRAIDTIVYNPSKTTASCSLIFRNVF